MGRESGRWKCVIGRSCEVPREEAARGTAGWARRVGGARSESDLGVFHDDVEREPLHAIGLLRSLLSEEAPLLGGATTSRACHLLSALQRIEQKDRYDLAITLPKEGFFVLSSASKCSDVTSAFLVTTTV